MKVAGLWRYPVKSMQGEPLEVAAVGPSGLEGDRRWAVQVEESGRILSAKREGRLLAARAATTDTVEVRLPSGQVFAGTGPETDRALSAWLEQPVHLVEADGTSVPTFESQVDADDDTSETVTWEGHPAAFVDSNPVHVLSTATLRAVAAERPDLDWAIARFRPNVVVDAPGDERIEDDWVGRRLSVGEVELEVVKRCDRCVMVTRPQAGGVDRQLDVLRHLSRVAGGNLGVLARVRRPGTARAGDPVALA